MAGTVLDASALLAFLMSEPGGDFVLEALPDAAISAVNLAEVAGKISDRGLPDDAVAASIAALPITIHPADAALAFAVGALRTRTRQLGLSLGDRFCLALGQRLGLPVLTADRAWAGLELGLEIRVIR